MNFDKQESDLTQNIYCPYYILASQKIGRLTESDVGDQDLTLGVFIVTF